MTDEAQTPALPKRGRGRPLGATGIKRKDKRQVTYNQMAKNDIERLNCIHKVICNMAERGKGFHPADAIRGLQECTIQTILQRLAQPERDEKYFIGMAEFYDKLTSIQIKASQEEHLRSLNGSVAKAKDANEVVTVMPRYQKK